MYRRFSAVSLTCGENTKIINTIINQFILRYILPTFVRSLIAVAPDFWLDLYARMAVKTISLYNCIAHFES